MAIKSYRRFLLDLIDELGEAMRQAEEQLWHHAIDGTPEKLHYIRLVTWTNEVSGRIRWYNDATGKTIGVPTIE